MIYWHSGTGNSRHVADLLSRRLGLPMTRITPGAKAAPVPAGEKTVWVFPVYAWGMPAIVRNFINASRGVVIDGGHFMVCTCGDDVGLTHLLWRKAIRRNGWNAVGCWSVTMPNNYVMLPGFDTDAPSLVRKKLDECAGRVKAVARGIESEARVDDVVRGSAPWLKTRVLRPLFNAFLISPKSFRATDACTGCGKCWRACPCSDIKMEEGRPRWGADCTMCLACYHVCPHKAVAYGRRSRGKGQYFFSAEMSGKPGIPDVRNGRK